MSNQDKQEGHINGDRGIDADSVDTLHSSLTPGREVGRYVVQDRIGAGGMGRIYKVWDNNLHRSLAMKLLPPSMALDPHLKARFEREIEVLASQEHPAFVKVFEAGSWEGAPYYVMELVEGSNLDEVIEEGEVELGVKLRWIAQIANALDALHAQGVVHRDVKPSNILIRSSGEAVLSDFGLAHFFVGEHALTQSGVSMGTPAYMAPEQVKGERARIGPATDIYQLGATLYTCICNRQPYEGKTPHAVMLAIAESTGVDFRRAIVPAPLKAIVSKAMAPNPNKRYASAHEFAQDIERFLAGEWVLARGRNPVRRAIFKVKKYAIPALVAAVGIALVPSIFLVNEFRTGNDQHSSSHRISADGLASPEGTEGASGLVLSPFHTTSAPSQLEGMTRFDAVEGEDAPEMTGVVVSKTESASSETAYAPAMGWDDFTASFEFHLPSNTEDNDSPIHCFVGAPPEEFERGIVMSFIGKRSRLKLSVDSRILLDVPLRNLISELPVLAEVSRRGREYHVRLTQPQFGAPRQVFNVDDIRASHSQVRVADRNMGMISKQRSLEVGNFLYQQLLGQSDRIDLVHLKNQNFEQARMHISARLDLESGQLNKSVLERYRLNLGLALAGIARKSAKSLQALLHQSMPEGERWEALYQSHRSYISDAQSALEIASEASNDSIALSALLAEIDLNLMEYEFSSTLSASSLSEDESAFASLVQRASWKAGSDVSRRSTLVCRLSEWSTRLAEQALRDQKEKDGGEAAISGSQSALLNASLSMIRLACKESYNDQGLRVQLYKKWFDLLERGHQAYPKLGLLAARREALSEVVERPFFEQELDETAPWAIEWIEAELAPSAGQRNWYGVYRLSDTLLKHSRSGSSSDQPQAQLLTPLYVAYFRGVSSSPLSTEGEEARVLLETELQKMGEGNPEREWIDVVHELLPQGFQAGLRAEDEASIRKTISGILTAESDPFSAQPFRAKGFMPDQAWKKLLLAMSVYHAGGEREEAIRLLNEIQQMEGVENQSWLATYCTNARSTMLNS